MATLLRKGKQHSCLFYVDQNDLSHYCSPQSAALIRQPSMRRQQGSTTTGTTKRLSAPLQTQDSHCAHTGKTLTELVCQTYQTGRQCQQPAGKTRFSVALSAEVDSAEGVGVHNVHWYGRPTLQLAALALRRVGLATTTNAAAGGVIGRADRPSNARPQGWDCTPTPSKITGLFCRTYQTCRHDQLPSCRAIFRRAECGSG